MSSFSSAAHAGVSSQMLRQVLQSGAVEHSRASGAAASADALQSCLSSNSFAVAGLPHLHHACSSLQPELQHVLQEQHSCVLDSELRQLQEAAPLFIRAPA
jgi:hypothetical protein